MHPTKEFSCAWSFPSFQAVRPRCNDIRDILRRLRRKQQLGTFYRPVQLLEQESFTRVFFTVSHSLENWEGSELHFHLFSP